MNLLDKGIGYFDPQKALLRARARTQISMIDSFKNNDRGYGRAGASRVKNSLKAFFTKKGGPDKDIIENLEILRQRSRDLYMGVPIASGILKKYRTCVVGQGLVPKPNLNGESLGISEEEAREIEKQLKREFNAWAKSQNSDAMRMHNFYTLQGLVMLSWVMNGDVFIIPKLKNRKGVKNKLCVQVVEADRIRNPTGNLDESIKEGVEIDEDGEVTAYYIANKHPGDETVTKTVRVEAYNKLGRRNILHIFEPERPDQRRGVPLLAPVIESLKQIGRYSEAELMAAVVSGMFTVFIEQGVEDEEIEPGQYGVTEEEKAFREESTKIELGNGAINILKPGEKVESANPGRPNSNYKLFVDSIYEEIGSGIEMPKEVMLNHFTSSYTAARASLEEAWRRFISVRSILVNYFCQPIYEEFILEQVANGTIKLPGYFSNETIKKEYSRATWVGPNKISIDPYKEMKANEVALSLNITNREIISQEKGYDFDEVITQKLREDRYINENTLKGGNLEKE